MCVCWTNRKKSEIENRFKKFLLVFEIPDSKMAKCFPWWCAKPNITPFRVFINFIQQKLLHLFLSHSFTFSSCIRLVCWLLIFNVKNGTNKNAHQNENEIDRIIKVRVLSYWFECTAHRIRTKLPLFYASNFIFYTTIQNKIK